MPALGLKITGTSGRAARIATAAASVSAMLLPQFAPMAANRRGPSRSAVSVAVVPIIVRPAVSKLIITATGRSHAARAPRTAASASARSLIVSIHSRSAPPRASPSACSA